MRWKGANGELRPHVQLRKLLWSRGLFPEDDLWGGEEDAGNRAEHPGFIGVRLAGLGPPKRSASALLLPTSPQKVPGEEQLRRGEVQYGGKMNLNGLSI